MKTAQEVFEQEYLFAHLKAQKRILEEIVNERTRQDEKWGVQNCAPFEWLSILVEEVGEVAKAANNMTCHYTEAAVENYREELVQVAAVVVSALECLDRNGYEADTADTA